MAEMREVRNVFELIQVMHDDPSYAQTAEFSRIQAQLSDPNFSVTAMREYQPDLYNWVTKITKEFWERRTM